MEEELKDELDEVSGSYEELKDEYLRLKELYEEIKSTDRKKEVKDMNEDIKKMKEEILEEKTMEEKTMEEKTVEEKAVEEKTVEEEMTVEKMTSEDPEERMKYMMEKLMNEELSMEEKEEIREVVERMMYEKNKKEEKSSDMENKNTELVDNRSILDNDLNNDKTNFSLGEEDMNEKQMQEFAQMIARSVSEVVKPTSVETNEKIETLKDSSVEELRSQLTETQNMLAQVMRNPVRRGRHLTTTIRGVGAKTAYSELVSRSRSEGVLALSAVVEDNVDLLSTDKVAEMTSHQLRALLSSGLNAAQADGILGQPSGSWE